MIEPEMCFADLFDDMECGENYLKFCLKYVLENNKDDLEFLEKQVEKGLIARLKNVIEEDFKKLSYTEAIEILKESVAKDKKLFVEEKTKEEKEAIAKAKKEKKEAAKKAKAEKAKSRAEEKEFVNFNELSNEDKIFILKNNIYSDIVLKYYKIIKNNISEKDSLEILVNIYK